MAPLRRVWLDLTRARALILGVGWLAVLSVVVEALDSMSSGDSLWGLPTSVASAEGQLSHQHWLDRTQELKIGLGLAWLE